MAQKLLVIVDGKEEVIKMHISYMGIGLPILLKTKGSPMTDRRLKSRHNIHKVMLSLEQETANLLAEKRLAKLCGCTR